MDIRSHSYPRRQVHHSSRFIMVAILLLLSPSLLKLIISGANQENTPTGWNTSGQGNSPDPAPSKALKLAVLLGIMTTAQRADRRHLLRMLYRVQPTETAHFEVRFVVGRVRDPRDRTFLGLERLAFDDIMELDCEENMNHGKTFAFFSAVAATSKGPGPNPFDYVMKLDDDSYVRLENLARRLSPLPRSDLYYGYVLPCENQDPQKWYMAGMGYAVSWDLVEWILRSPIARNSSLGTEDELVGRWFDEGGRARNRVSDKPLFYDHPGFGGPCAHELVPETVLVHQLKSSERWADVISFFGKFDDGSALSS